MYSENCVLEPYIPKSYHSTERSTVQDLVVNDNRHPISDDAEDNANINSTNEDLERNSCLVSFFTIVKNINELPADLQSMLPAFYRPLPNDYNLPPPPPWLDIERVQKGQAFGLKYFYGLNYANAIVLPMLFAFVDGVKPLIFTEKSHTSDLAKKRYLSTILRFKSWYETELWKCTSEGYRNLKYARAMHLSVSKKLNSLPLDEEQSRLNLEEKLKTSNAEMMCPLLKLLKKDFSLGINGPTYQVHGKIEKRVYLNQMEMAFAHFGFFGLMVLYPDKFAAKTATDEELSDFVHLWRYIGYMLGLDDEYNLCSGDLETVRKKGEHMVEYFARPLLLKTNQEWEHMSYCALRGIEKFIKLSKFINFESGMLYLYWLLGIETPHLKEYLGWKEKIVFSITKYLMTESYKIPGLTRFLNFLVKRNIEQAAKTEKI